MSHLSAFQVSVVLHALSFPSVNRVVYSTCSVNQQENEDVVFRILSQVKDTFMVKPFFALIYLIFSGYCCFARMETTRVCSKSGHV